MKFEELAKSSLSKMGVIRVRTALNPLLWLVAVTLPFCVLAIALVPDRALRIAFLALSSFVIVTTVAGYFILLFRAPDRLQSEEYLIRQTELKMR